MQELKRRTCLWPLSHRTMGFSLDALNLPTYLESIGEGRSYMTTPFDLGWHVRYSKGFNTTPSWFIKSTGQSEIEQPCGFLGARDARLRGLPRCTHRA